MSYWIQIETYQQKNILIKIYQEKIFKKIGIKEIKEFYQIIGNKCRIHHFS